MVAESFGHYLRALRKQAALSQRELAQRAGIDFTYLSKIENNRVEPPAEETMRALARAVGADAEGLLARARKLPRDLKHLVAQGSAEKALLLRRIAQTPMTPERVDRMLRLLEEPDERHSSPRPAHRDQRPVTGASGTASASGLAVGAARVGITDGSSTRVMRPGGSSRVSGPPERAAGAAQPQQPRRTPASPRNTQPPTQGSHPADGSTDARGSRSARDLPDEGPAPRDPTEWPDA